MWNQVLGACSPLLLPQLPWGWGAVQGTAGERMHSPSGLLGPPCLPGTLSGLPTGGGATSLCAPSFSQLRYWVSS
jgi:hypothetical protein